MSRPLLLIKEELSSSKADERKSRSSSPSSSNKRMVSILAFLLAWQQQTTQTLASTRGSSSDRRPPANGLSSLLSDASSSWHDQDQDYSYSSDTNNSSQQQQQQHSRRYHRSPLYGSEEEDDDYEERRIVAALAKVTTTSSSDNDIDIDNDNDNEYDSYEYDNDTNDGLSFSRRSSKKKRTRRMRRPSSDKNHSTTANDGNSKALGTDQSGNDDVHSMSSSHNATIETVREAVGNRMEGAADMEESLNSKAASTSTRHSVVRTWDQFKQRSRAALQQQQQQQPSSKTAAHGTPFSSPSIRTPPSSTRNDGLYAPSNPVSEQIQPRPSLNKARESQQQQPSAYPRQSMFSRQQQQTQQKPKTTKQKALQKQQTTRASPIPNSSITPWVRKFVISRTADGLVPVPRDYLADNFNLVRLPPVVEHLASKKQEELEKESPNLEHVGKSAHHHQQQQQDEEQQEQQSHNQQPLKNHPYALYRQALDLILCQEDRKAPPVVQYAAEVLYGLIHARFIVSTRGLDTMRQILVLHASNPDSRLPLFGRCPRLRCKGMPLLPCGLSDDYDLDSGDHNPDSRAKRYCCNCRETFHCWESKVDGSAWGTSACHLLLMVYGKEHIFPSYFASPYKKGSSLLDCDGGQGKIFEAASTDFGHIFGFPVHPSVTLS